MKNTVKSKFVVKPLAVAVALGSIAGPTFASSMTIEEVIVTATKRDESVQDVPISIDVLGEAALEEHGVGDLEDLAHLLPALNYVSLGPGTGNVYMRGISSGGESILGATPNVAVYMDEQPITAVGSFLNPHIYDIARVETLAGPQGTLFGANSQAGSLRFITNKPEIGVFSAGFDVEFNSINEGGDGNLIEGFVNIPIGDRAAVRVVGYRKDEAGFVDNVAGTHTFDLSGIRNGWQAGGDPGLMALSADQTINNDPYVEDDFNEAETVGGRAALKFDLNDNWTITASYMRQELDAQGVWDHDPSDIGDLEVVRFQPDTNDDEWSQIALVVEGMIGDYTLTYAYSDLDRESEQQADYSLYSDPSSGSPGYVVNYYACYIAYFGLCEDPTLLYTGDQEWERENHEIRLMSPQDRRFRWLLGIFYEEAVHDFDLDWHVLGLANITPATTGAGTPAFVEGRDVYWTTDQNRSNEELAYFGEIAFDITEDLTVSASARRFDYDSQLIGFSGTIWWPSRYGPRTEAFNTNLETNDKDTVAKFNVAYNINDAVMVYYTWSEGYRPGGLNRVYNTDIGGTYSPDFLESNEVGFKSTLWDGRLQLNGSYFQQEWDNFQLSKIDTSVSVLTLTDNVGNATSDGFEIDGRLLLTENWDFFFGLSYIDATLEEGYWLRAADEGVTPPQAPKGSELPRVPDLKWNISSRYNFQFQGMDAYIQGSYTSTGESYNLLYDVDSNSRSRQKQDSYQVGNIAVGVDAGRWSAELFVKNVGDKRGEVYINGFSYDQRITVNRPRTVGLRIKTRFQ